MTAAPQAQPRIAMVTGGTSGIGLSIVKRLVSEGWHVYFCGRDETKIREVERDAGFGLGHVVGDAVDVTQPEDVARWVAHIVTETTRVDALINNAGTSGGGPIDKISDETWNRILTTNLDSVFYVTRAVMSQDLIPDFGRIVNIASTAGKQGIALATPYSASKHGVIGFTKSLGKELATRGITVNAVCPGYVETPMAVQVRQGHAEYWNRTEEEILETFNAKIPLGRYSTPEEVAGMVNYLLSDDAASVTAQAFNVCGGLGNY
ncbi:SDR family NAD(P)-dependent oxidoreductase [Leucobacter sp. M11]|uniref:SDR family NAD(P)-dependent oxidoreductase n=1 Tax=Leucobacter sp. M11 TaxID=2993565 RepID=UPI002D7FB28C|nr:SDR family NAD(P)-dependent oxidoreductase [Leucobacter sp. M11]MEB4613750.1 SDR family NAD(P)-dependent oxidoreductase [Leucobacter sp. M11]